MTTWLNLKRLLKNNLDLPKYQTTNSAGIDFAACLTRPCIQILPNNAKRPFLAKPGPFNTNQRDYLKEDYKIEDLQQFDKPALYIEPNETIIIPLGWQTEFNAHCVLHLYIRSSLGLKGLNLANGVGVIDSDYRGDLMAIIHNRTTEMQTINHGDRIVQGIIQPLEQAIIAEKTELSLTQRGTGGLGSTGTT